MEWSIREEPTERILVLTGRFSYADAAAFGQILRNWDFHSTPSVAIDAHGLLMVDSVAIGMLFLLAQQCRTNGGGLRITSASSAVRHTLRRAGLLDLLRVEAETTPLSDKM